MLLTICVVFCFTSNANAQKGKGKLIEFWKGTLDYDGTDLEMGLKVFRMQDGTLTAKFSSYSQGAIDLPVEFEKNGNDYKMNFPAAQLKYTGALDESKQKLLGSIKQRGREDELNFTMADFDGDLKLNRPQTPKAPLPYDSEDVRYKNDQQSIELAGTLTLPRGKGPFPVAITISGSGGADRDESHFGHKPFLVIADHLARKGVAVLRFDDRGIGQSTGDRAGATSADFATDVEAGIEFLKQHPKIDQNKIGMIGHSEGGLIAPLIAESRDDVHFIVLLAGTGVDGGVILKSQSTAMMAAAGESNEKLDANRNAHDAILSVVAKNPNASDEDIETASESYMQSLPDDSSRKLNEPSVKQLVDIMKSPWVRYFVNHNPAKTLAKVNCHVLAMNGEKDLQVLCDLNLKPIEAALRKGSPASFKVVRLENTNHMFQETDGSGAPDEYGKIEQTFSPKALSIMSRWIKNVTK
jgi:pimeloyl-ACP methyl ester carboxylesterase